MNISPLRQTQGSACVALVMLLLGCHVPQEVIVETKNGKTVRHNDFTIMDSSIVLPHLWIDVKSPDGNYQIYQDSTVLPLSRIDAVTLSKTDATSSEKALGAFAGGIAGVALGAWAGSSDGFGPTGGIMTGGNQPFVSVMGGAIGVCVGVCLGIYVAERVNVSTMHFNPAVPAEMDSMRVYSQYRE